MAHVTYALQSGSATDQSTNDRKVAGSRPNIVVCVYHSVDR